MMRDGVQEPFAGRRERRIDGSVRPVPPRTPAGVVPVAGFARYRARALGVAACLMAAALMALPVRPGPAFADAATSAPATPAPAAAAVAAPAAVPGAAAAPAAAGATVPGTPASEAAAVARALATRLVAARAVVSSHQNLINDPSVGDKGLTAALVLRQTDERFATIAPATTIATDTATATGPATAGDRSARLLAVLDSAIVAVVEQSQPTINAEGVGFKGFIPAVFARLVTTRFNGLAVGEAQIRVTAPPALVRNRSSRPDAWESEMIATYLSSPTWAKGAAIETAAVADGRPAFRLLIPEYYGASCLSCHGQPAGEIDRTGYPKEGASEGDLGGVISVILW